MSMGLHDILFAITTISMFFSGYSWRKKSVIGIMASSLLALIPPITETIMEGVPNYGQIITNMTEIMWLVAISYTVIVWMMGYIAGGFSLKKKDYSDDFPRKDINCMRIDLDNK